MSMAATAARKQRLTVSNWGGYMPKDMHGWPRWFQIALAVIELGLPPVFFWPADAEERTPRSDVELAAPAGPCSGSGRARRSMKAPELARTDPGLRRSPGAAGGYHQ
ncbi:hypothetical protein [Streptomyces sp. Inha503]|uniref:hypothetical protein n=1 Tax=Streptomyces sp. Inha503 TaxID=3383314 RepID=UPI0039A1132B